MSRMGQNYILMRLILILKNINHNKGAWLKERVKNVYKLIFDNPDITQKMFMSELDLSRKRLKKQMSF